MLLRSDTKIDIQRRTKSTMGVSAEVSAEFAIFDRSRRPGE